VLRGGAEHLREDGDGERVQPQLRFVQDHQPRRRGLEEEGGEADEAQGAVGHRLGEEHGVRADLLPPRPDPPAGLLGQDEVTEVGRGDLDRPHDLPVFRAALLAQPQEEGGQVAGVRAQGLGTGGVAGLFHRCVAGGVLEVVHPAARQCFPDADRQTGCPAVRLPDSECAGSFDSR
jgi:hypothetical protein